MRLEALRQMRVCVQRDAVGPQRRELFHRARERFRGLARQAMDQVDVDRIEADRARRLHQRGHLVERLHAVHRALHVGVEVLHAETQSVEAQAAQMHQALGRDGARVDLDRTLRARREVEGRAQRPHQALELDIGQEGRCATAQVQLRQRLVAAQHLDLQGQLTFECAEIGSGALVVAGDDLVAGAVEADRLAKRNMHVDRQRRAPAHQAAARCTGAGALGQRLAVLGRAEGVDKSIRRRVRGVAGARRIELLQQRVVRPPPHRPWGARQGSGAWLHFAHPARVGLDLDQARPGHEPDNRLKLEADHCSTHPLRFVAFRSSCPLLRRTELLKHHR